MPRWLQILLHFGAVATGSYLSYSSGTPIPLIVSSGTQALISSIAQTYNTDGTPQEAPFIPKNNVVPIAKSK